MPGKPLRAASIAVLPCLLGVSLAVAKVTDDAGPAGRVSRILLESRKLVRSDVPRGQKIESLQRLARDLVDTREMGSRAVGPILAHQTTQKREEFLALFGDLVVRSYLQKLLFFRDPRFRVAKAEIEGSHARVPTRILTGKDSFSVSYEMRQTDGTWKATDIVIEGISLTSNYSEQFRSLLGDRTFDELLALMKRKVGGLRDRGPR